MGLFGGVPESGNADNSFGSKLRTPSYGGSEFDSSTDSFGGSSLGTSAGAAGGMEGELQQQVAMEQQKLQFMSQVHKLNETCWEMCVGSPSSSLSGRETNCLTNCVERFIDTTMLITNRFAQLAQKMQR